MFVKFLFGLKSATFKVQLFTITEPEGKFVVLTGGGGGLCIPELKTRHHSEEIQKTSKQKYIKTSMVVISKIVSKYKDSKKKRSRQIASKHLCSKA